MWEIVALMYVGCVVAFLILHRAYNKNKNDDK